MKAFFADRDKYQHYVMKLRKLKAEKIEKEAKGLPVQQKAMERLIRNEAKLDKAAANFKICMKKIKEESDTAMGARLEIVNPILLQVIITVWS